MKRHAALVAAILSLTACGGTDGDPDDPLPPPSASDGFQVSYRTVVEPGTEAWKCNVVDLPNPRFFSVNHVVSVQNEAMHHMDLMATALAVPELEVGEYDCRELYDRYPKLMEDGIIIYASQQAEQEIVLPAGTVAELLPRMRVMHEIHFVNPSEQPIEAFSKINAYAYDDALVERNIWGGAVRDLDINIPGATSSHIEWTRCVMNADVDVLFLSTHTHALARQTVIRQFDGSTVGPLLYTNTDWHAPKLDDLTAAPLHVPAGAGFEFECHYQNQSGSPVHWGFTAAEEMCQIALVYTPGETTRTCQIVGSGIR